MEKLYTALCQWIALHTHYFNFQFSYLYTFYKPNIKVLKQSLAEKLYLIFKLNSIKRHKYSTLDGGIKGEESLKKLLWGVIPLL